MDMIRDHLSTLNSLASHSSTLHRTLNLFTTTVSFLSNTTQAYLLPLLANVSSSSKPDLASAALLVVILVVSVKVLSILLSTLLWWIRLVVRLSFYGALIALVTWVVARGPEAAVQDVQELAEVWMGEYDYWRTQTEWAKAGYGGAGGGYGRVRAGRYDGGGGGFGGGSRTRRYGRVHAW